MDGGSGGGGGMGMMMMMGLGGSTADNNHYNNNGSANNNTHHQYQMLGGSASSSAHAMMMMNSILQQQQSSSSNPYPMLLLNQQQQPHHDFMDTSCNNINNNSNSCNYNKNQLLEVHNSNDKNINNTGSSSRDAATGSVSAAESLQLRAKIMAHPLYLRLLSAYINCQKVIGAPPEVVARLEELRWRGEKGSTNCFGGGGGNLGEDPALDQFMEAYCEMLTKYEQEISKPFNEALLFVSKLESQFKDIVLSSLSSSSSLNPAAPDWTTSAGQNGSSSEEKAIGVHDPYVDGLLSEDSQLKSQLLQKYSGYLGSLKQEFLKRKKKGKLPIEARQQLLEWWRRHYKWPYPSEDQKVALAQTTGLDQKQINNWFINQRKRHWKPTEDMQLVVMDGSTHHPNIFMDSSSFMGSLYHATSGYL